MIWLVHTCIHVYQFTRPQFSHVWSKVHQRQNSTLIYVFFRTLWRKYVKLERGLKWPGENCKRNKTNSQTYQCKLYINYYCQVCMISKYQTKLRSYLNELVILLYYAIALLFNRRFYPQHSDLKCLRKIQKWSSFKFFFF